MKDSIYKLIDAAQVVMGSSEMMVWCIKQGDVTAAKRLLVRCRRNLNALEDLIAKMEKESR